MYINHCKNQIEKEKGGQKHRTDWGEIIGDDPKNFNMRREKGEKKHMPEKVKNQHRPMQENFVFVENGIKLTNRVEHYLC